MNECDRSNERTKEKWRKKRSKRKEKHLSFYRSGNIRISTYYSIGLRCAFVLEWIRLRNQRTFHRIGICMSSECYKSHIGEFTQLNSNVVFEVTNEKSKKTLWLVCLYVCWLLLLLMLLLCVAYSTNVSAQERIRVSFWLSVSRHLQFQERIFETKFVIKSFSSCHFICFETPQQSSHWSQNSKIGWCKLLFKLKRL